MSHPVRLAAAFGLSALLGAAACSSPPPADGPSPEPAPASTRGDLHERGEQAGIHNMAEVAPGLYRGAQPEGDAAFALLASLEVRTIVSVDGARPDVEAAARHGIRYVHLPMEYSGIPRGEQVKIAKVAKESEGGLFLHCHHGKHRGPAAVAIAWMARDGCPAETVLEEMHRAGTDPRYEGLYADVREFRPVTGEELAAVGPEALPSVARVPDFIEAMVRIDASFERMKAVRKAGWKSPASMPDVLPAHEARILAERFRETSRLEEAKSHPEDFRGWLGEAEKASWDLEASLRDGGGPAAAGAAAALDRVSATCGACHDVYRNRRR